MQVTYPNDYFVVAMTLHGDDNNIVCKCEFTDVYDNIIAFRSALFCSP